MCEYALNFLMTKDIGGRSLPAPREDICGGKCMTGVFRMHEARKASPRHESVLALCLRGGAGRPGDHSLRHDMGITVRRGKTSEAPQVHFHRLQLKAGGTPHGQIGVHGGH